jgi:hypothetical protein
MSRIISEPGLRLVWKEIIQFCPKINKKWRLKSINQNYSDKLLEN